jgi:hypothetical protein
VDLIVAHIISIMQKTEYKILLDEFRALYNRDDWGRDLFRKNYPFINKGGENSEVERLD